MTHPLTVLLEIWEAKDVLKRPAHLLLFRPFRITQQISCRITDPTLECSCHDLNDQQCDLIRIVRHPARSQSSPCAITLWRHYIQSFINSRAPEHDSQASPSGYNRSLRPPHFKWRSSSYGFLHCSKFSSNLSRT